MRKKDVPEIFVRAVMSLHHKAKMQVTAKSELSEEF